MKTFFLWSFFSGDLGKFGQKSTILRTLKNVPAPYTYAASATSHCAVTDVL